jgi:Xaa-Pro aminopeptidase
MKTKLSSAGIFALAATLVTAGSVVAQQTAIRETVAQSEAAPPYVAAPAAVLANRRAALVDSVGAGVVLIRSSSLRDLESEYLQASDFRQDNNFFYLTGIEVADSWLLVDLPRNGSPSATLFIPERNPAREQWTGPRPSLESAAEITGLADVRVVEGFEEAAIAAAVRASDAALPVYAPLDRRMTGEPVYEQLTAAGADIRDIRPIMAQLRLVKDDFELETLQRAIDITAAAQRAAMRTMRPGMYEYETEAVIEYNFRAGGAERVGFPSIVGSGPNSVVLHYDRSRRQMEAGDLVVMDIGAEYSYYTADVTRTVPVSGKFTERQRAIYDLVLASQQAGIDAVRPGATMADVNRAARVYMRDHSGDLCGEQTCDAFFIHGVGHWLGMDVHDVGANRTPFATGMVLTVEPGIYISAENLGVRIEDDVVVTETGSRMMSAGAPRSADAIEAMMGQRIEMR